MEKTIYIVSGLPRSGTSMMMQMLHAGGLEALTDKLRTEDENNPKGYFEFEKVKSMAKDTSWMPEASGKVVKIIAQLLQFLPPGFQYKIVFMKREMQEVLASQQKMLGKSPAAASPVLADVFSKQLVQIDNLLKSKPNVSVHYVNYSDIVGQPQGAANEIAAFLELNLDIEKMAQAVDGSLYRNKL